MIVKKYEFPSEKKADEYIKKLGVIKADEGNEHPSHKNSIVKLGFICIKDGEYNDEGEQIQAPEFADKYSVDVLWHDSIRPIDEETEIEGDLPLDLWADYEIILDNEGVHEFMGVKYITE